MIQGVCFPLMKIVGIIQARMSSTRLPGKVLLKAAGEPLIVHMLERVSRSRLLNHVRLATSEEKADDLLAEVVEKSGYNVFRGSLDNVLSRFHHIGKQAKADVIVRLTGDCPLHDPEVIDSVIGFFLDHKDACDYVSNVLPPTFPDGLDTEVFTFTVLDEAYRKACSSFDLEHVVPYVRRTSKERGRIANYFGPADFSHLRWTVDEPEDYEFVKTIFDELYPQRKEFGWLDVIAWQTKDPKRLLKNAMHMRNAGLNRDTIS